MKHSEILPFTWNMRDCLINKRDHVFAYQVYKRMFTPYEQEQKFTDESEFTDIHYQPARIVEAVELGGGDWLIGFHNLYDDSDDIDGEITYYRLSDISLFTYGFLQEKFDEEDDDDQANDD